VIDAGAARIIAAGIVAAVVLAAAGPPALALFAVCLAADRGASDRAHAAADHGSGRTVPPPCDAVPRDAADQTACDCTADRVTMSAAARHIGVVVWVVPAMISVLIGRRRIPSAGAALDTALIASFVATSVGGFVSPVPRPGPAPLGLIGSAVDRVGRRSGIVRAAAIFDFARDAVRIAGINTRVGRGGRTVIELGA